MGSFLSPLNAGFSKAHKTYKQVHSSAHYLQVYSYNLQLPPNQQIFRRIKIPLMRLLSVSQYSEYSHLSNDPIPLNMHKK